MLGWIVVAAAEATQLAIDRLGDDLVVVTTWHLRPEIHVLFAEGGGWSSAVDEPATNPTVRCDERRCLVGWVRPGAGLGAVEIRRNRQGVARALTDAPITRAWFAADGRAYTQASTRTERGWSWSVSVSALRRGGLGRALPLADDTLPGLYAIDGEVWWRTRRGSLAGTGAAPPERLALFEVHEGAVVPLGPREGLGEPLLATLSPDGDAAVWAAVDGTLHAARIVDGALAGERVVETVEPMRVAHTVTQMFVGATLADEEDGRSVLAIPVDVVRAWTGEWTLKIGDQAAAGVLRAPDPRHPPPVFPLVPGDGELTAYSHRPREGAPEGARREQWVGALPALAGPCAVEAGVMLRVERRDDGWRVELTRRGGVLDDRIAGELSGPAPDAGDTLVGEVQCGAQTVPLELHWRVGAPQVTETLASPKPLWSVF